MLFVDCAQKSAFLRFILDISFKVPINNVFIHGILTRCEYANCSVNAQKLQHLYVLRTRGEWSSWSDLKHGH